MKLGDTASVLEKLERLDVDSLKRLSTLAGVTALRAALAVWAENEGNDDEEFWQATLAEHAFVLSQAFSLPVIVVAEKAYVGGKGFDNSGGNVVDFLLANRLTDNAALVEIKTPTTRLLGQRYRGNVYSVSPDVVGAVIQAANYKDSLLNEFTNLSRDSGDELVAFNPRCLVIAGNTGELDRPSKTRSLELFRSQLTDVELITFDELFEKVRVLADLLEGSQGD